MRESDYFRLHCISLLYITLHHLASHHITLHRIRLHCIIMRRIRLHNNTTNKYTIHYITLQPVIFFCITLHYILYIHTKFGCVRKTKTLTVLYEFPNSRPEKQAVNIIFLRLVSAGSPFQWYQCWSVVEPTPLKNDGVSSSVGMTFPTEWNIIEIHGSIIEYYIPLYPNKNTIISYNVAPPVISWFRFAPVTIVICVP